MTRDSYPRAFISYAHEDKDTAMSLAASLVRYGVNPWIDAWEIGAGDSLIEKVFEEGLKDCAVFIILLSPASTQSAWVKQELDVAVINRIRRVTQLIPVVVANCAIPTALRAIKWIDMRDGLEQVTRDIVDAAYRRTPQKPLIQSPPDRVLRMVAPQFGLSQEATTIGAMIARSFDVSQTSQPFYEGKSIQAELELTAEQINDAVEELATRGFVKLYHYMGTDPFDFGQIEPTYALYYTFSDYLKDKFNPEDDVKQVAATVVSLGEVDGQTLTSMLGLPAIRVNYAVAYLLDYGIAKVLRTLGTSPYDFAQVIATGATRRFIKEQS